MPDGLLYWADANSPTVDVSTDDGRIRSVPLGGGAAATLASNQLDPVKMVLVGGNLFWSTGGSLGIGPPANNAALWSMPAAGGIPTALVSNRGALGRLAVDATHFAWIDESTQWPEVFVESR